MEYFTSSTVLNQEATATSQTIDETEGVEKVSIPAPLTTAEFITLLSESYSLKLLAPSTSQDSPATQEAGHESWKKSYDTSPTPEQRLFIEDSVKYTYILRLILQKEAPTFEDLVKINQWISTVSSRLINCRDENSIQISPTLYADLCNAYIHLQSKYDASLRDNCLTE